MKIALINGSPKVKYSSSECVLQALKSILPKEHEVMEYHFRMSNLSEFNLEQIRESDILVFAFPLYVDGIPSHLINCLYQIERFFNTKPLREITVYAIVNCGFYEGKQNVIALEMIKNWCEKTKLNWGQGIGIGGGGMLPMLAGLPDGKGPKKNLSKALKTIANSIAIGVTEDDIFISPNFPRFAYKFAAEMGWRKQIKENGLRGKDLFIKK
ncbi:hypothetical protein GCM10008905_19860 [Clostridium malenominatum]|uniref:NADPH-dependent FMN reductase-like domain-containing protein n=1 Tax=Clostridium malenominatum TaxID=1539 RepID=A0ABN1J0A9_9CLOT